MKLVKESMEERNLHPGDNAAEEEFSPFDDEEFYDWTMNDLNSALEMWMHEEDVEELYDMWKSGKYEWDSIAFDIDDPVENGKYHEILRDEGLRDEGSGEWKLFGEVDNISSAEVVLFKIKD